MVSKRMKGNVILKKLRGKGIKQNKKKENILGTFVIFLSYLL